MGGLALRLGLNHVLLSGSGKRERRVRRRGRHLPPVCGGFRRRSVTDSEGRFLHPLAEGGFISWGRGVQNEPRPWVGE